MDTEYEAQEWRVRAQQNGTPPVLPPALEAHVEQIAARIQTATAAGAAAGYEECARRDAVGERWWRQWRQLALGLGGLCGVLVLILAGLLVFRAPVQAFVEVVVHDDAGHLLRLSRPVRVQDYTPTEGEWRNLLGLWVEKIRTRGQGRIHTEMNWAWAKLHTCEPAASLLLRDEKDGKPTETGSRQVLVKLRSITRQDVPELSFAVDWVEDILDRGQCSTEAWRGTFTVGRVVPRNGVEALHNGTGVCITGYGVQRDLAYVGRQGCA